MTTKPLSGRTALVLGGSRGIGAAIARRLARDGARVTLTAFASVDRGEAVAREICAAGGEASCLAADSADPDQVRAAVKEAARPDGRLDILINNAGIGTPAAIPHARLEDYDRTFAVNVRAAFVAITAAAPLMPRGGRIITIGSVNADRVPFAGGAIYAASKAALAGLTRGAARDLGPAGITVNLVQPGPIDTEMNPADGPWADAAKAMLATGRYGRPGDVAALVAFLAGPESGYITGAALDIDGGYKA